MYRRAQKTNRDPNIPKRHYFDITIGSEENNNIKERDVGYGGCKKKQSYMQHKSVDPFVQGKLEKVLRCSQFSSQKGHSMPQ